MGRGWVVGIVGPSGCGKSTLSQRLTDLLNDPIGNDDSFLGRFTASAFPEDPKYFKAKAPLSYKDRDPISESPISIHWDDYAFDLQQAISKISFQANNLDKECILLVEHFLLLHDARVRDKLDLLIFLDPSLIEVGETKQNHEQIEGADKLVEARDTCRERRVTRNKSRSREEQRYLRQYYNQYVWPNYLKHTHGPCLEYLESFRKDSILRINTIDVDLDKVVEKALIFLAGRILGSQGSRLCP